MIQLQSINLGYGKRCLIKDASAVFQQGVLTALIGRNGTGKSTLLRAMAGLGQGIQGSIRLNQQALCAMESQDLAQMVSFVSTERVRIVNLRCCDVVALGRAPYTNWIGTMQQVDRDIVEYSLERVGMGSYAQRTMNHMSDGECQRIMIARALAQQTPIMLLDEPTSFLDMPSRYELADLLATLAHEEQKCIVFSTHELDIALALSDTIALIDSPQLIHLPVAAMEQSGHLERLFHGSRYPMAAKSREK